MAWYRAGTVTVANGSSTVTGAGTDFVANAQIGHAFLGPDGKVYEIAQVEAAGQIVLSAPYLGGSGGGQGYAIMPTSSFARDLALGAAQLLNTFATVRDTVGQGLFPDGTLAAPGIRFNADEDTGMRRSGDNALALVVGGRDAVRVGPLVDVSKGGDGESTLVMTTLGSWQLIASNGAVTGEYSTMKARLGLVFAGTAVNAGIDFLRGGDGVQGLLAFRTTGMERCRIDEAGSLLIGVTSGPSHVIDRAAAEQTPILIVSSRQTGVRSAMFYAVGGADTWAGSGAALYLNRHAGTGRSLNAGGTVNASGADYAEYMRKAAGCGTIAKGDVCGVDRDGYLTKMWADAISFVIKSTDPSYVGGDIWGRSVGPRPEGPGEEPTAPIAPPSAPTSEDEADVAAWRVTLAAYQEQLAAYQAAHAAWTDAKAAYDTALPAWEAALEVERQKVDRVAFSGQVPVNISGDFAVGDYLIATANGAGIKAVAVPADTITFDQYRRRVGKVWAVRDGRAWVDVQHG
ncbi:hypothetical protein [Sphingomonas hankookensis]